MVKQERIVRSRCDTLLVARLAWKLQEREKDPSAGISASRIGHSAARLLLDWDHIRRNTIGYEYLYEFAAHWTPYRFGSLFAHWDDVRASNRDRPPLYYWFPSDILTRDQTAGHLGIRNIPTSGGEGDRIYLPTLGAARWHGELSTRRLDSLEAIFIDQIADTYAQIPSGEMTVLASCPNILCTKSCLRAEMQLWHYDYGEFLAAIAPENLTSRDDVEKLITPCLENSYTCATQIFKKITMATEDMKRIRTETLSKLTCSEELRRSLCDTIEEQARSDFDAEHAGGRILAAISSFSGEVISNCGFRVGFIVPAVTHRTQTDDVLKDLGLGQGRLDRLRRFSSTLSVDYAAIKAELGSILIIARERLRKMGLPDELDVNWWNRTHVTL